MKILLNFKCKSCGAVAEYRVESSVKEIGCACDGDMVKMLSSPRYLGNTTGKSPARR